MVEHDWWKVARIKGSDGTIEEIDEVCAGVTSGTPLGKNGDCL